MSHSLHKEKGQSLVETSLTIVVFFALVIGILDLGQMLFVNQALVERARVAARWGAVHEFDRTAIENLVLFGSTARFPGESPFWGLSRSNLAVTNPGCGSGSDTACRVKIVIEGYSYPLASAIVIGSPKISVVLPSELP